MYQRLLEIIQGECEQEYPVIVLDGLFLGEFTKEMKNIFEKNEEIQEISLKNCSIKNLKNFPLLQNLVRLDLSGNLIKGRDLKHLQKLKNLQIISLSYCQIDNLEDLKPLKEMKNLIQLNIKETKLAKTLQNQEEKIFKAFPYLQMYNDMDCFKETLSLSSSEISDLDQELEIESKDFLSSDSSDSSEYSFDDSEEENEENVKLKLSQFQINNEFKNDWSIEKKRDRGKQFTSLKKVKKHQKEEVPNGAIIGQYQIGFQIQAQKYAKSKRIGQGELKDVQQTLINLYKSSYEYNRDILFQANKQNHCKIQRIRQQKKIEEENEKMFGRILQKKSTLKNIFIEKNKSIEKQQNSKISENQLTQLHEEIVHTSDDSTMIQICQNQNEIVVIIYLYFIKNQQFSENQLSYSESEWKDILAEYENYKEYCLKLREECLQVAQKEQINQQLKSQNKN